MVPGRQDQHRLQLPGQVPALNLEEFCVGYKTQYVKHSAAAMAACRSQENARDTDHQQAGLLPQRDYTRIDRLRVQATPAA